MNNIKKIALGLLVAVLAFGFSAFKGEKNVSPRLATSYYQISPGIYSKVQPDPTTEECLEDANPCVLQFPNTIPGGQFDTFDYSTQLGAVTAVGGTPDPSDENGVWQ